MASVPQISPEELARALKAPAEQRPVLLDVRNPDEHAYVTLPEATLIPLHTLHEHDEELEALRGKPVVVYCHHGVRSLSGAAYLQNKGIDARSLTGGIDLYAQRIDPALPRY